MTSINQHLFFCVETDCSAEAYVSGGRCDLCFSSYIKKLREAHNPSYYEHTCSGEFDYDLGYRVCDERDDLRCPSNRSMVKCCFDCGYIPQDGHFPAYRGNQPLCATCEEEFFGPPSPKDWRERTGSCTKCYRFYDLICSSDDRTCCPPCAAKGTLPPVEELDCPGCGGSCRPGAAGYCSACWQQRYGCEDE